MVTELTSSRAPQYSQGFSKVSRSGWGMAGSAASMRLSRAVFKQRRIPRYPLRRGPARCSDSRARSAGCPGLRRARELGGRATRGPCERLVARQKPEVLRVVRGFEARHRPADVLGIESRHVVHGIAKETARDGAERDEGNTKLLARVEHGNLRIARPQRILGLHRGDRM